MIKICDPNYMYNVKDIEDKLLNDFDSIYIDNNQFDDFIAIRDESYINKWKIYICNILTIGSIYVVIGPAYWIIELLDYWIIY
jgi:hypothetical protein